MKLYSFQFNGGTKSEPTDGSGVAVVVASTLQEAWDTLSNEYLTPNGESSIDWFTTMSFGRVIENVIAITDDHKPKIIVDNLYNYKL